MLEKFRIKKECENVYKITIQDYVEYFDYYIRYELKMVRYSDETKFLKGNRVYKSRLLRKGNKDYSVYGGWGIDDDFVYIKREDCEMRYIEILRDKIYKKYYEILGKLYIKSNYGGYLLNIGEEKEFEKGKRYEIGVGNNKIYYEGSERAVYINESGEKLKLNGMAGIPLEVGFREISYGLTNYMVEKDMEEEYGDNLEGNKYI